MGHLKQAEPKKVLEHTSHFRSFIEVQRFNAHFHFFKVTGLTLLGFFSEHQPPSVEGLQCKRLLLP